MLASTSHDLNLSPASNIIMSVPRERLLQLMQTKCRIFATTFNPDGIRMGNKILRQRLRGPALASYYPRKVASHRELARLYAPELEFIDEEEEDRLEHIALLKLRGKSAPKKKDGPAVSKGKR